MNLLPEVLDYLNLLELHTMCQVSRSYENLCADYVPVRVAKKHSIKLTPLGGNRWRGSPAEKEFRILASYLSGRLQLVDAVLDSISTRNYDLINYFLALVEERHGVYDAMALILIGIVMYGDIELFKHYYNIYVGLYSEDAWEGDEEPEETEFRESIIPVVRSIAEREYKYDIVNFIDEDDEDVAEATSDDVSRMLHRLNSARIFNFVKQ